MKKRNYELLLSKITHELRNPVTLINSYIQLMEQEHPEIARFNYYDQIQENMKILRSLLGELSNFNHAGHLCPERIRLHKFLKDFVDSAKPILEQENITLKLNIRDTAPEMMLDPIKLHQLLSNLLRNSVEAIRPDSGIITITLSFDSREADIEFIDTGCGMTEEQLDSAFQPFVSFKKDGTGLGLPICAEIMRAHGGSISAIAFATGGAAFTAHFPYERCKP